MSYSAGTFFINLEGGSDTARTALTSCTASNPSGSITRINKTAHGLVTGAVADLTLFSTWLNEAWKITVVDADNFDLDGAVWQTTADASGTVTPRGGSSKTDAWLTIGSGATAARIQPGDTCRIMASPDPTLVGSCTWTNLSRDITLPGAVTANITDCESVWTASANITATAQTNTYREGTKSAQLTAAAGFTTGKMAYFATGTLDLSAYQQVSMQVRVSGGSASGDFTIRLCSDTVGDTTVHTITIPATVSNTWTPVVFDNAGALNSAIASIALYAAVDPGTKSVWIDNVIACKASSSADSLTHNSLIGKVHNLSWAASTTYAANDKRRPTQPNRNGFQYKVTAGGGGSSGSTEPTWPEELGATVTDGALTWTCQELEDTWYPIASINGTTVQLDSDPDPNTPVTFRGYHGATETVATYKREPTIATISLSGTAPANALVQDSGTAGSNITFSGGWNRTDMTTQTGETWGSGRTGYGGLIGVGTKNYLTIRNLSGVKYGATIGTITNSLNNSLELCHGLGCTTAGIALSGSCRVKLKGTFAGYGQGAYSGFTAASWVGQCVQAHGVEQSAGVVIGFGAGYCDVNHLHVKNNNNTTTSGIQGASATAGVYARIRNLVTSNNNESPFPPGAGGFDLINASIAESVPFAAPSAFVDGYISSTRHQQTVDNHLLTTDGGTIASATDQRHTASGIAWKFLPTSTNRGADYPLRLIVLKLACAASGAQTVKIWARRDSTNIKGILMMRGGQLAGVAAQSVALEPTINTWVESAGLTFTATEAGIVEIEVHVYDGVGTSNALWIDDLTVT